MLWEFCCSNKSVFATTICYRSFDVFVLAKIETLLQSSYRSMPRFSSMHFPNMSLLIRVQNILMYDELNYKKKKALASEHFKLLASLDDEL